MAYSMKIEYSCVHKVVNVNLAHLNTHFSTYPGVGEVIDQIESKDKGVEIQR